MQWPKTYEYLSFGLRFNKMWIEIHRCCYYRRWLLLLSSFTSFFALQSHSHMKKLFIEYVMNILTLNNMQIGSRYWININRYKHTRDFINFTLCANMWGECCGNKCLLVWFSGKWGGHVVVNAFWLNEWLILMKFLVELLSVHYLIIQ